MNKKRGVMRWLGRWLLRLAVWSAVVAGLAYGASRWYLPAVVQRQLSQRLPEAAVAVQGARFSGLGVLIKGLAVAEDESLLANSPIFFAERVRVSYAPGKLVQRQLSIGSAVVADAVLTIEYEKDKGWNVQRLGAVAGEAAAAALPLVRVERAAVRVRRIEAGNVETITAVGLNGRLAAAGNDGLYGFSFQADDRLALSGSWAEGTLRLGDGEVMHRLRLTGQLRMPRTRILDNAWNVDDVQLACAFDAESVEVERLTFRMGEGTGTASARAEFSREGGFEASVDLTGFSLTDAPAVDAVVYGQSVLELLGPAASRFLNRFRPRGAGDVHLQVRGRWDHLREAEVYGQVICRDVSVQDERFPYRLEQMAGMIEFSGRSLTLNRLVCRHGESEFAIEGGVDGFGPNAELWLRVVSGQIRFDEDVYRALGPEAKRLWFAFMPSGTGAIDHRYRRFGDGRRTRRLEVELIDAAVMYEHFPYPLEHLTGRVVFEPNWVTLSNVRAAYPDGRSVAISGTAAGSDDFSIRIHANRIPVDAMLLEAMTATQRDYLERFEIDGGMVSAEIDVFADPSGERPFDYRIDTEVSADRFVYADFAVPLEDVRITAEAKPRAIELERLTGRSGQGRLSLSGRLTEQGVDPDLPGVCLDIEATAFPLTEAFWAAAERHIRPDMLKIRPYGPVHVLGRWGRNLPEAECAPMDVTVVCHATPLRIDGQTAGQAFGTVRIEKQHVRLEHFRIEQAALTESLAAVMPDRMRQAYEPMDLSGRIDVSISTAVLTVDEEGLSGLEAAGRLSMKEVKSRTTDFVERLNGSIEGRFSVDADQVVQELEAFYQMEGFRLRGRDIDRLSGQVVFDPNDGVLVSRNFSAVLGEGIANGSLTMDIQGSQSFLDYTLDLMFEGLDVARLVSAGQVFERNDTGERGKVKGTLSLQGRAGRSETKQGRLNATVSEMRLGRQSLIGKVLTAIQFREPKDYVFNRMELDTFIRGDEAVLDRIRIVGRPFVFHGDGRLNLKTYRVAVDLVALGGLAGTETVILDSLLRGLGSAFWKIEIRDDMRDPTIRTISLPILQLPLDLLRR